MDYAAWGCERGRWMHYCTRIDSVVLNMELHSDSSYEYYCNATSYTHSALKFSVEAFRSQQALWVPTQK